MYHDGSIIAGGCQVSSPYLWQATTVLQPRISDQNCLFVTRWSQYHRVLSYHALHVSFTEHDSTAVILAVSSRSKPSLVFRQNLASH